MSSWHRQLTSGVVKVLNVFRAAAYPVLLFHLELCDQGTWLPHRPAVMYVYTHSLALCVEVRAYLITQSRFKPCRIYFRDLPIRLCLLR
jgi:hypothetical protein